ncbi:MAG: ATP-binding protein [Rhodanobacteraceae bacterium]
MLRFEARVLYGALLTALPALAALIGMLAFDAPKGYMAALAVGMVIVLTVMLARWQFRRVVYPVNALSSLIEALREGDYSLRGSAHNVMGDLVRDLNDLAEHLQAQRLEFEESSYLLGKTLAALDSAVFVFDAGRRLRLINPAGQKLLDDDKHRLFGLSAEELGLAAMLELPRRQVMTHAFPGRAGRFDVRHAPLRSGGRGGSLLVINDVGQVLRQEERQAWQRLLRVLGHEVNNSLAPIQSMAATLAALVAREPLPDDWREDFASGLNVVGKRAGALSRFLSGYSRLARLPPPERRPVDVADLVNKVVRLEQRGVIRVDPGEQMTINADPDQIEQALINLVANAIEAIPAEGGEVSVRWRRDRQRVLIDVRDNGPGPPRSDNLFVPFFTTKPGGSGIGLALVRQIAEAHDGGVSLTAGDGSGAVATLSLPASSE